VGILVLVLLAEGFEEIEAIGTVDILRRAELSVTMVSISDEKVVASARGVKVFADAVLSEIDVRVQMSCEALVLPGGGEGVKNLSKSEGARLLTKEAAAAGKMIAAICAAPTFLGQLGLLEGKNATCYPGMESELNCGKYLSDAVVVDGKFITSRGAGTTHLFAAKIVEELASKDLADSVLEKMIFS